MFEADSAFASFFSTVSGDIDVADAGYVFDYDADDQIPEDAGDHDDDRDDDDSDGVVSATRQYERYHGEDADNESSA